jgi:uncharacterized membrane protein
MFTTPAAVIAVLAAVAAFYFWLEQATKWKLFQFLPPLLFIYSTPLVLTNTGILPEKSPAYDVLNQFGLPVFITLLLLSVDVGGAFRIMGRGVFVMLIGTAGVILGAPIGYFFFHRQLAPETWKGFGALAGSWIGGTGNMAAVAGGLETPPEIFGLAVLADNVVFVVWLPLLLASKGFAERFNRWTRVKEGRVEEMERKAQAAASANIEEQVTTRHFIYLGALALIVTAIGMWLAPLLPAVEPILTTSTWRVLIVTTLGIALSFTPAKRIPRSHQVAMAIVYVFVACMGARASLAGLADAPAFLAAAFIWIFVHGLFTLAGAYLFRVDVHSAAIASCAIIGGVASAPIVAAHHRESLVPVSILMALIGYAIGNYGGFVTARLCYWVAAG